MQKKIVLSLFYFKRNYLQIICCCRNAILLNLKRDMYCVIENKQTDLTVFEQSISTNEFAEKMIHFWG